MSDSLSTEIERIVFAFDRSDSRREAVRRLAERARDLEAKVAELEKRITELEGSKDHIFVAGKGIIEGKIVAGPHGRIFVEKDGARYRLL